MFIILSFSSEDEKNKFQYIYDKYKKLLLYKAYDILKDYSMAEDAVSEGFIRIYKNLHKIDDVNSNSTICFLVTIVKNISITILNKEKKSFSLDEFEEKDNFDLEEYIISKTITEDMLKIVDTLKDDLKSPFLLKYAYNMSHREIGSLLNISENNVTVRIHRAKKKLIKLLSNTQKV